MSQQPAIVGLPPVVDTGPPTMEQMERVLVVGLGATLCTALDAALGVALVDHRDDLHVESLDHAGDLTGALQAASAVAVCFGPQTTPEAIASALDTLASQGLPCPPVVVTGLTLDAATDLAAGPATDLERKGRFFYRSTKALGAEDLAAVIASAKQFGGQDTDGRDPGAQPDDDSIETLDADLAACRDAESGVEQLTRTLRETLGAAHADVWIETPHGGQLRGSRTQGVERIIGLDAGMIGFAGRTGASLQAADVGDDPRFDPAVDLPLGIEPGTALVHGLRDVMANRTVVIAVFRRVGEPVFDDADAQRLTQFLARARPHFKRWAAAEKAQDSMVSGTRELYRREALSTYLDGSPTEGDLLRTDPGWTRLTYRLLLGFLAIGLLFSIVARVGDYAEGPAVIRFGARVEITAHDAGTVDQVLVRANQSVTAGDLLVRLHSPNEAAEVMRLEQEFALRLRQRLRDAASRGAKQELIASRTHLELARAKLKNFEVRAPEAGVVSDVRIRSGLHLAAGDVLLTLVTDQDTLTVLALLPGAARPALAPGQSLRIALDGYPGTHHDLRVASVGQEVIGPAEARRAFGGAIADAVLVEGPVVLVDASLPSATFESDGRVLTLHDGMHGRAEVKTRTRPFLFQLIPGLEGLFQGDNHG